MGVLIRVPSLSLTGKTPSQASPGELPPPIVVLLLLWEIDAVAHRPPAAARLVGALFRSVA
jgi:hypothetical protein